MKKFMVLLFVMLLFPMTVEAQRGCCSRHGGVVGCGSNGKQACADGTYSPSCTCTPAVNTAREAAPKYYGCTNKEALNYDASATVDNGSCISRVSGCMDQRAVNYNSAANVKDGSCQFVEEKTMEEEIPYQTKKEKGSKELVKQKGQVGKKMVTKRIITDENGNVVSNEVIAENVVTAARNEIVVEVPETLSEESSPFGVVLGLGFFGAMGYTVHHFHQKKNTISKEK